MSGAVQENLLGDLERARELFADGLARHVEQNWAEAEQLYRQALHLAPDRPSVVFNLGRLMLDQQKDADAEAWFRRSLELAPDHESSYNLAVCLARQGKFESALAPYDQAIALAPGTAAAHAGRGWVLEQLGRPAEALESHARSVELAPELADLQVAYCRCAALAGAAPELRNPALLETAVLICLMAAHADVQNLKAIALALLERRFAGFWGGLQSAGFEWSKIAATQPQDLRSLCGDWLLMATLEKIALTDAPYQAFFSRLRASLLKLAVVGPKSPELSGLLEPLALFLAQQCCLNQYVWDAAPLEVELLAKLRARVADALAAGAVNSLEIGVLGSYVPLFEVPGAAAWSATAIDQAEPALKRLLKMQVQQPLPRVVAP